jgi:secondary thiamine-phosphate synthase enzyme
MATTDTSNKLATASPPAGGLRMYLQTLSYKTRERLELINITRDINEVIRKQGLRAGLVLVQTLHTTAAIFINEFQQALLDDIKSFIEKFVGRFDYWRHNDPRLSDCNRQNADAHLRAMVLGHTLSLPVRNGELALGYWQSVILAELDGPRDRAIHVQILGTPEDSAE